MTIKQMEYILELARTKNFNRAAENLFITQPALSYQIGRAEEEVGFRLFTRTGKGATVTIAGEEFIRGLAHIIDEYNDAVEAGSKVDPALTSAIAIGISGRFVVPYLLDVTQEFAREFTGTPIVPKLYSTVYPAAEELAECDIAIVPKARTRFKGFMERAVVDAYEVSPGIPGVDYSGEYPRVWMPLSHGVRKVSVLVKIEEERREVEILISRFLSHFENDNR